MRTVRDNSRKAVHLQAKNRHPRVPVLFVGIRGKTYQIKLDFAASPLSMSIS